MKIPRKIVYTQAIQYTATVCCLRFDDTFAIQFYVSNLIDQECRRVRDKMVKSKECRCFKLSNGIFSLFKAQK